MGHFLEQNQDLRIIRGVVVLVYQIVCTYLYEQTSVKVQFKFLVLIVQVIQISEADRKLVLILFLHIFLQCLSTLFL